MAQLEILHYPDPRLYTVAAPVDNVDDTVRRLLDDMAETMYLANGIGLAATQVNVHRRIIVIDVSEDHTQRLDIINPKLLKKEGEKIGEEGCLSVPGVYDKVQRAEYVVVEALDRNGNRFELAAEGLLAVCIQHEMDHLDGKVFVDYLSRLKRTRIAHKIKKMQREEH